MTPLTLSLLLYGKSISFFPSVSTSLSPSCPPCLPCFPSLYLFFQLLASFLLCLSFSSLCRCFTSVSTYCVLLHSHVGQVFLGSAHIFLQPLAFGIEVEEEVPVSNYRGKTVAKLAVQVALCSPEGVISQGYQAVEGPTDLKDQRLDIVVKILYASDVEWINQEHSRGVQCKFRFYTDSKFRETKTVFSKSQPNFKYTKQFTIGATQAFLNYLQTNALIVELWGAQGNGSSVKPSRVRFGSQNRATPSAQPLVDSSFNASACANANANMESILKESEWAEERRHLQDQVHQLEQEIDFLHIEKGVLVRVRLLN